MRKFKVSIQQFINRQRNCQLRKWVTLLLVGTTIHFSAFAGVDPPVINILDGNLGHIKADTSIMVEDAKFYNPSYSGLLLPQYPVTSIVSLEFNEELNATITDDFNASVAVRITYTLYDNSTEVEETELYISYNDQFSYANKHTYVHHNAYRVNVEILDVDKDVAWDAFKFIKLVNQLQSSPLYVFSCSENVVDEIFDSAWAADTNKDELPVYWAPVIGADEYDLEWTYIDSSAFAGGRYGDTSSLNADLLFDNNASRVTITGTIYNIPLLYDNKGHLFFRVRPVQWAYDSATASYTGGQNEANWSSDNNSAGLGRFDFNGHERTLNWQATTTFAEDGKRKTVVQYYDGSLRARQTVTKDNSTNQTIVAESFYDYQGRPVIQVLPAPTLNTIIGYTQNFNRGINGDPYRKGLYDSLANPGDYCDNGADSFSVTGGAAQYYSPNNPLVDSGFHKYLPDANGYPFTEVQYTQDNTGRISRQSGVGEKFRIGSGHETKYFYGTADQRELDALFGTEVGDQSHYFKTMVRDANGQYSVSYTDMRGRTIATALAGVPPDSIKLDTLASYTSATRTEVLSDPASVVIKDLVMESKKGLLVPKAGNHTFLYQLNPESLLQAGCDATQVCYECLYDLQITITDDCNNQKLGGVPFDTLVRNFSIGAIDTACNESNGFSFSFVKYLQEGSYEITKKLSVSRYGADYYRDSFFLPANTCKTLDSFLLEQRLLLAAVLECKPTCENCTDSLGTFDEFRDRFMQGSGIAEEDTAGYHDMVIQAYQQAQEDCALLCDSAVSEKDDIRRSMLMDMTPSSGQYANINNETDPLSIFFFSANGTLPDTTAKYKDVTNYKDPDGSPAMVFDEGSGKMVPPRELSAELFAQKFQSSWAEALLYLHPEYCKLQKYELLNASHEWDRRFGLVDSWQEAKTKGYLNPVNESTFTDRLDGDPGQLDVDPLGTLQGGTFMSKLVDSIKSFRTVSTLGTISMWGVACVTVMCDSNQATCYTNYKDTANVFNTDSMCVGELDMAWRTFRQMYLDIKRNIINQWLSAQCSSSLSAAALVTANHSPHFSDATELLSANGVDLPQDGASANTFHDQYADSITGYYNSNCNAYVQLWLDQLGGCTLYDSASLHDIIIPRLLQVCKEGADEGHPYGASSIKPSSSYAYYNFEAVINAFNDSVGIEDPYNCTAYKITAPQPYNQQPIQSNKPLYNAPDSCECAVITSYYSKYSKVHSSYGSFSNFMSQEYQTVISDSVLNLLLSFCSVGDAPAPTCSFLETPIALPPAFQCYAGDICVTCEKFLSANLVFQDKYPTIQPVLSDTAITDSLQLAQNLLYEQFMNNRLGYSKTAEEYLTFRQQCQVDSLTSVEDYILDLTGPDTADISGVTCDTLETIANEFDSIYAARKTWTFTKIRRMQTFYPTLEYRLSCSGITVSLPTAEIVSPEKWVGSGFEDPGFGRGWNGSNFTFVKFNFSSLPSNIIIDSINLKISPVLTEAFDPQIYWMQMLSSWDTTLACNQLGQTQAYTDPAVLTYSPLYSYQSAENNTVNVYDCNNYLFNAFITNLGLNQGYVLGEVVNNPIMDRSQTFLGTADSIAQADPEVRPRKEIWYSLDTLFRCQDLFTAYFNARLKTNISFDSLSALYLQKCSNPLPLYCEPVNYTPLCGRNEPVFPPVTLDSIDNCSDSAFFIASKAQELYKVYTDSLKQHFDSAYRAKCLQAYKMETFTVRHEVSEFHHTLYYYDQAGNLVKTVPPAGVNANYDSLWLDSVKTARLAGTVKIPNHTLVTQYRYNTLNQVISQKSPDGGKTDFWYDRLGRLVLSRNARQLAYTPPGGGAGGGLYSYTRYDELGRITEVGQLRDSSAVTPVVDSFTRNEAALNSWFTSLDHYRGQVTNTIYDIAYDGFGGYDNRQVVQQQYLRNRVSYVTFADSPGISTAYNTASFYSYDIHGNVDTLLQDYGQSNFVPNIMNKNGNRFKKFTYQYDLISGKVNMVMYQRGWSDQWFHRYLYDAENRLTEVETSLDSLTWERDAHYEYYRHGPLARMTIGQQQVQGMDYAYTLQGWLKGVNSTGGTIAQDMGGDGKGNGINQFTAKDAYSYSLNYFAGDYAAISGNQPFPGYSAYLSSAYRPLFNGNISSMSIYNSRFEDQGFIPGGPLLFYNYHYDQLNRLTGQDAYKGFDTATNSWSSITGNDDYLTERIAYDANGNILKYLRNAMSGYSPDMDSLNYYYIPGTNQLRRITDNIPEDTYIFSLNKLGDDIDQQPENNYAYDAIGNLVKDSAEGILNIKWSVYGKILEITRTATDIAPTTNIKYTYDALGNRISKVFDVGGEKTYTWYVRDAQGNLMSVYTSAGNNDSLQDLDVNLTERYIYGSSRLGMYTQALNVDNDEEGPESMVDYTGAIFLRGFREYELTNHLGNVLDVLSDKKFGIPSDTNSSLIAYYEPDIITAFDYFPFGAVSRLFYNSNYTNYRFGFNGKEMDHEAKGNFAQLDYGMRIYDPRAGRFLSVDPLTNKFPWLSPYQYASNSPIELVDIDGSEGGVPPKENTVVNVFIYPSNLFNPASNNVAQIPGYLQAKAQEQAGNNIRALKVASATDAYNQIFQLKQQGYIIGNLVIESHGNLSENQDSYVFKIGEDKFKTGSEPILKQIASDATGSIVLTACHAGNNKELMNNLRDLTGRSVIASEGWVSDWPGMFNDEKTARQGVYQVSGFLWDNSPDFREKVRKEMSLAERLGEKMGLASREEIVNAVTDEIMNKYVTPLLRDGISPSGNADIWDSYYNPDNDKHPEFRTIYEKKVGVWNIAKGGADKGFEKIIGALLFGPNGDVLQNKSKTFYQTEAGKLYKQLVEERYSTKLNVQE